MIPNNLRVNHKTHKSAFRSKVVKRMTYTATNRLANPALCQRLTQAKQRINTYIRIALPKCCARSMSPGPSVQLRLGRTSERSSSRRVVMRGTVNQSNTSTWSIYTCGPYNKQCMAVPVGCVPWAIYTTAHDLIDR